MVQRSHIAGVYSVSAWLFFGPHRALARDNLEFHSMPILRSSPLDTKWARRGKRWGEIKGVVLESGRPRVGYLL